MSKRSRSKSYSSFRREQRRAEEFAERSRESLNPEDVLIENEEIEEDLRLIEEYLQTFSSLTEGLSSDGL